VAQPQRPSCIVCDDYGCEFCPAMLPLGGAVFQQAYKRQPYFQASFDLGNSTTVFRSFDSYIEAVNWIWEKFDQKQRKG